MKEMPQTKTTSSSKTNDQPKTEENGSYHKAECTGDRSEGNGTVRTRVWLKELILKNFCTRLSQFRFYAHNRIIGNDNRSPEHMQQV